MWLPLALAGSASLLAALAFPLSGGASWFAPLADARDNVFGSLQTDGAARDVTWAFVQAGVAALAAVLLIWGYRNARISIFFIALITADLLAANSWLVQTAPFERWQSASLAADTIREHASERPDPIRVFRAAEEQWLPIQWRRTSSSNRLEELLAWNRDTLYPKHNLTEPIALVETLGSAGRYDWQLALAIARENGPKRTDGRREPPREFLDLLGAEYFILPPEFSYPGSSPLPYPAADSWAAKHSRVWHNPHARPIAWIVHETSVLPQLTSRDPHRIAERTRNVLFSESPDWRRMAVVEADDVMPIDTSEAASECRVLEFEPGRLVIEVDSPSNGWLVVSHAFDPAWQAEAVETDGTTVKVPLYRTNRLLLGAPIPAGRTTLNLTFRPTGNYTAGIVSASAWGLWGLVIAAMLLRHARRRREIAGRRS